MLRVKNQNIYITRGETATLEYEAVRRDGAPYILAPIIDKQKPLAERNDYAVLALTVKTGVNGEIVLAKYLDLEAPPMYDGYTDYSDFGLHKFRLQEIQNANEVSSTINTDVVYKIAGIDGYCVRITNDKLTNFADKLKQYRFKLNILFSWYETANLDPKEYVYDINLYYGKLKEDQISAMMHDLEYNEFPFIEDDSLIKIPLVLPHTFVVEDSYNA